MSKYDEIMDYVTLTDEKKDRILSYVLENVDEKAVKKSSRYIWIPIVSIAVACACLLVVLVPSRLINKSPVGTTEVQGNGNDNVGGFTYMEYSSIEELCARYNYDIKELQGIPFTVRETKYVAYGRYPEIQYRGDGENNIIYYRTYTETGDQSGYYGEMEYDLDTVMDVAGTTVGIEGYGETVIVCYWSDDNYTHSVVCISGMTKEQVRNMVQTMMSGI